jgi:hypothetical protein
MAENKPSARPTDDTIALAAFLLGRDWLAADELRHALARLGFDMPSSQWIAARLAVMSKESAPRFLRRKMHWTGGVYEYRVTSWAATGLGNQWQGFDNWRVDGSLPTPQPEHLRHPASVPAPELSGGGGS